MREAYYKYRKSATLAYHETDDSITDRLQWACWQASWQACAEQKDKRIAELTAQNKELVEALHKHGRHLADCAFLPNWIDAKCNCGLFKALAKAK